MVAKKVKKSITINAPNIKSVKKTVVKKKEKLSTSNGIKVKKIKKLKKIKKGDLQNKLEKSSVKSLKKSESSVKKFKKSESSVKKSKLKKSKERKLNKKTKEKAPTPSAVVATVIKEEKSDALDVSKANDVPSETGRPGDSADDGEAKMAVVDPEERMEVSIPRDMCAVRPSNTTKPKKKKESVNNKAGPKSKKRYYEKALPVPKYQKVKGNGQWKKMRRSPEPNETYIEKEKKREESKKYMEKLMQRERELAADIFGIPGDDVEEDEDTTHFAREGDSMDAVKVESNIPEDPFDIHRAAEPLKAEKRPAWVDEDDEIYRSVVATAGKSQDTKVIETSKKKDGVKKYQLQLKEKFMNSVGSADWADLSRKPTADSDDEDLVRKTGNYLSEKSTASLPKMSLEYEKMNNLNRAHTEGVLIKSIDFNPHHQVALVAGEKNHLGAVTLYQVDGKENHKIHSVRFPGFPVTCAQFLRNGKQFVVGSENLNYFYIYDMETSKELKMTVGEKFGKGVRQNLYASPDGQVLVHLGSRGMIYIYDTVSFSLVDTMEAPCNLTSATFNSDGSRFYTHGVTGEVYIWDMTLRECIHKFCDDGCMFGESIAVSPNNQYLACGSRSGIVNIYDCASLSSTAPAPIKILSNLTTRVTSLAFNPSSEILALSSSSSTNAIKLVHFPSMTVFKNFPSIDGRTYSKSETLQFSPQSGYFAVGVKSGEALLFRLNHYSRY